jgi:hypothetical protein
MVTDMVFTPKVESKIQPAIGCFRPDRRHSNKTNIFRGIFVMRTTFKRVKQHNTLMGLVCDLFAKGSPTKSLMGTLGETSRF